MNNQPNRKRLLYLEIDQISSIIEVWRTKKRVTTLVIIITLYIHPPLSFPRKNLNLPSYINRIFIEFEINRIRKIILEIFFLPSEQFKSP